MPEAFREILVGVGHRETKKQKTRKALADAAVRLFTDNGYDNVTMAEIAASADVSRRTAFRYFPSKDDLVLEYPNEWRQIFDSSITANQHLSLSSRLRRAVAAVGDHIEQDPAPVRLLFGLAFEHPSIAGRYAISSQEWIERIHAELVGSDTATRPVRDAQFTAAALMGIVDAACGMWAKGEGDLSAFLNAGLDLAETTLLAPDASRRPTQQFGK